jgi:hypothetical protein
MVSNPAERRKSMRMKIIKVGSLKTCERTRGETIRLLVFKWW